jgi:hypothetical protein
MAILVVNYSFQFPTPLQQRVAVCGSAQGKDVVSTHACSLEIWQRLLPPTGSLEGWISATSPWGYSSFGQQW